MTDGHVLEVPIGWGAVEERNKCMAAKSGEAELLEMSERVGEKEGGTENV